MAFEIYNGTGTALDALAKMNEMWDFDSYDADNGIAVYGNVRLEATRTYMNLKSNTNAMLLEVRLNGLAFKIVKAEKSIMLSWVYNSDRTIIVLGEMTDGSGNTDGGAVYKCGSSYLSSYTTAAQTGVNCAENIFRSDSLTQFIPIISNKSGTFSFVNAFQLYITSMTSDSHKTSGIYQMGDDRYYLDNYIAIKEE